MSVQSHLLTWAEPTRGYAPPEIGRWGMVWRYGLATVPLLVGLAALSFSAYEAAPRVPVVLRILDPLLFLPSAVLIRYRRRFPLAIALVMTVINAFSASSFGFWAWAVISMATRRRWRWVLGTGALTLVTATTSGLFVNTPNPISIGRADGSMETVTDGGILLGVLAVTVAVTYSALVAWGFYIGARRDLVASLTERAETAERERSLLVGRAQAEERARIAREMHDVLAHRISLVGMHAGILAYRDDLTPEQTREVAGIIQANANASLTELRAVLGTLRAEGGGVPQAPQPTLADLPALLDEQRAAGLHLIVEDTVTAASELPTATGRHAYRIVQEALTNARKHAVGAPVRVALSGRPGDGLELEVSNPLTAGSGAPRSGLGLVGLAERAQMVGGRFSATAQDGRFVVRAWLPWET